MQTIRDMIDSKMRELYHRVLDFCLDNVGYRCTLEEYRDGFELTLRIPNANNNYSSEYLYFKSYDLEDLMKLEECLDNKDFTKHTEKEVA